MVCRMIFAKKSFYTPYFLHYSIFLTTGAFDLVAQSGQFGHHFIAMVTLDLDIAIFNSAARAAQLLELLCQCGQLNIASHYPGDNGHGFAAPLFAVAHHPHDAITFARRQCGLRAAAVFIWQPAGGTGRYTATLCRINHTIWLHLVSSHRTRSCQLTL